MHYEIGLWLLPVPWSRAQVGKLSQCFAEGDLSGERSEGDTKQGCGLGLIPQRLRGSHCSRVSPSLSGSPGLQTPFQSATGYNHLGNFVGEAGVHLRAVLLRGV